MKKVLIAMMIFLLAPLTAAVHADDKGRERAKHYEEQRREEMKHRQEQARESRKFHEEQAREQDKHRREMAREWEKERGSRRDWHDYSDHRDGHDRYRGPDRSHYQYRSYFRGHDRSPIDRYYADQFRRGKCPPGLVRTANGCMPRGLAKKWKLYRPLPRDVIYHDLPREVLVTLGPPPSGHRFVRVAGDILLLSVGTGMVIDAIEDLGRIY